MLESDVFGPIDLWSLCRLSDFERVSSIPRDTFLYAYPYRKVFRVIEGILRVVKVARAVDSKYLV